MAEIQEITREIRVKCDEVDRIADYAKLDVIISFGGVEKKFTANDKVKLKSHIKVKVSELKTLVNSLKDD